MLLGIHRLPLATGYLNEFTWRYTIAARGPRCSRLRCSAQLALGPSSRPEEAKGACLPLCRSPSAKHLLDGRRLGARRLGPLAPRDTHCEVRRALPPWNQAGDSAAFSSVPSTSAFLGIGIW